MSYTAVVKDQEELNRLIGAKAALDAILIFYESITYNLSDICDNKLSNNTYSWEKVENALSKIYDSHDLLDEARSDIIDKIDRFWDE